MCVGEGSKEYCVGSTDSNMISVISETSKLIVEKSVIIIMISCIL